jgi:hypothetical protein
MEDLARSPEERAEELKQQVRSLARAAPLPCAHAHAQGAKDYAEGRYEKALDLFSQAIALAPSSGVFYGNRSAALFQLQRWRECVADCKVMLLLILPLRNGDHGGFFFILEPTPLTLQRDSS